MKIPKYVVDLMSRSRYNYTSSGDNYSPGYTIDIAKYSHYETTQTFRKEIERLVKRANRQGFAAPDLDIMIAYILSVPNKTKHKSMQYATVTIFDPVMKHIEKYIPKTQKVR